MEELEIKKNARKKIYGKYANIGQSFDKNSP